VRRRPSGEPPPLPRAVSASTRFCLAAGGGLVALWASLAVRPPARAVTATDLAVLRSIAAVRTGWLTGLADALQALGSVWALRILVWPTLVVLLVFRRFARLGVFLLVLLTATAGGATIAGQLGRMRPAGIVILGRWEGTAHPSLPIAALGLALVGGLYTLVPAGYRRNRGAQLAVVPLALLAMSRLYLGVDHPTDVVAGLVLGVALPVAAFRLLVPDDAFPVSYRRGTRAHLDVTGRRGAAVAAALDRQLGLEVVSLQPFALGGSAGSTPLRIEVVDPGGNERQVFGKLYATSHLRSDRWYKLARTVLYGRLEDERPFNTVRRLVEYEDHMLRLMRDAGLPTPVPLGVVEITPEREYLVVTEFLERAERIGEGMVDETVIDDALAVVRGLWDAGLAHRDVKPGNLLVRDGRVLLIDLAFAAVRPSPWRQAVDLANMMLTLALYSTPDLVYERAIRRFTPDEISEAFAATRSVTVPSQLRALLRADGRHLTGRFRALAPPRPRVAVQRWSLRRVGLTLAVAAGALAVASVLVDNLGLGGAGRAAVIPRCQGDEHLAVVAQSVPDAAYLPCVKPLPVGLSFGSLRVRTGSTAFVLHSDRSTVPVGVRLQSTCTVDGATAVAPRADGVRSYELVRSISPRYAARLFDVFPGGCVTYDFDFARGAHIGLTDELADAVDLYARRQLRTDLRRDLGVKLDP
jgi:tRNA A-37 threonylcarbamoyl transferase component Bud32/membrane-associated phospholipid phosphatase